MNNGGADCASPNGKKDESKFVLIIHKANRHSSSSKTFWFIYNFVLTKNPIKQGENIGLMGSTGMSTGPHLHFEIKINGRTVDPEKILKFE